MELWQVERLQVIHQRIGYPSDAQTGIASILTSKTIDDGLILHNTYITAAVRCASLQNKPIREEMNTYFDFL